MRVTRLRILLMLVFILLIARAAHAQPQDRLLQGASFTTGTSGTKNGNEINVGDSASMKVTLSGGPFTSGTVVFEGSTDHFVLTSTKILSTNYDDGTQTNSPTVLGSWNVPCAGFLQIRARFASVVGTVLVRGYPSAFTLGKGGGSGAPAGATFITQTPNATLTNEQALSALSTGLLKNTTTTGVLGIGVAGTDYQAPLGFTAENSANKVTAFSSPTDVQYPSAKLVSDQLALKQDSLSFPLSGALGGTGVANTSKTITLGGNLLTSGAFGTTLTVSADSNSTLPAGTHSLAPLDSPVFTTPTLGVASATSINKVTITAPATGATLTIPDGVTLNAGAGGTLGALGFVTPGAGVATALAVNVGTAGSPVLNGGALGSPSSAGTLPAFTLGGDISGGGKKLSNVIIASPSLAKNAAADLATGGDGSSGTPWTGWDTALAALDGDVDVYFPAGIYSASGEIVTSTAGNPKNHWYLHGAGIGTTTLLWNTIGDGISNKYTVNGSSGAYFRLENLTLRNSNVGATGAGFNQVGGTYVTLRHVQIAGWKYGIIFDQTELGDVLDSEIVGQLSGGVGIWLVNGADHTLGASAGFTNRISIQRNQFNQNNGTDLLVDDGGSVHAIRDNNFNGGTNAIRIAGVSMLSVLGNEIEAYTGDGIRFATTTSGLGTSVGGSVFVTVGQNGTTVISNPENADGLVIGALGDLVVNQRNLSVNGGTFAVGVSASPGSMLYATGSQPVAVATGGTVATQVLDVVGGKGGNTTGTTGQTAGSGAIITMNGGAGGDAPAGSANGNGGRISLQGGAPGAGLGTAGAYGNILLAQAGGFVGINQPSPTEALHLGNGSSIRLLAGTITIDTGNIRLSSGNMRLANDKQINFGSDNGEGISGSQSTNSVTLRTNSTSRLTIIDGGNVGIGTTGPARRFESRDTSGLQIRAAYDALDYIDIGHTSGTTGGIINSVGDATANRFLAFQLDGSEKMRIVGSTGNVGIGTTAPASKLSIEGIFSDPVFTGGVLTGDSRLREASTITVRANDGGQFGVAGNSSHGAFFLDLQSITPTELVGTNYAITNYAKGDAGFAAGSTQGYGEALVRGIEHYSLGGSSQFSATLVGGSAGATSLTYTSPTNEDTLGVGRELIDTSIAETGTVASFSSTTVVGSGTSWTSALIGQFFKMDTDDRTLGGVSAGTWYKITAVTDTTHLTLERSYAGGATSGAYTINPGAEVIALDATANTFTVAANSVAWANGHTVKLRIYPFANLTPHLAGIRRYLPYTNPSDASFMADSSSSPETVGAAFEVSAASKFDTQFLGGGTSSVGINLSPVSITSDSAINLPTGKFVQWGSTVAPNNPGIVNDSTGMLIKSYGFVRVQKGDSGTDRLAVDVDTGQVTISGVLTAGSGPTTVTDAAGKVLSAALNTVAAAQGGTGLTALGTSLQQLRVNVGETALEYFTPAASAVIVASARAVNQTAANASVATYTVDAGGDASFEISMNLNVTSAITLSTSLNCDYTDESDTARTMIIPVTSLAGSFLTNGLIIAAGAYETPTFHIRAKAGTAITLYTAAGTYTSASYNVEGVIKQTR